MLNSARKMSFLVLAALLAIFLIGCENPETGSLYVENAGSPNPQPAITSISPTGGAFAGMDTLTIVGSNFSTVLAENTVLFGTTTATILSATATQMKVIPPLVTGDNIGVRVSVFRASLFSNTINYKLSAAIEKFGGLLDFEAAAGIAVDAAGNLYASYTSNGAEAGILKLTGSGARSAYAPSSPGVAMWASIKMGPSNILYAARGVRAIYAFPANGGGVAALWQAFPTGVSISDLDFDGDKNIWAGGNNTNIFRVEPNKTVTTYPFVGAVRSLRVYNGFLYFSAKTDAGDKIWRAQISGAGLGTPEVYFDFGAFYPNASALGITFSSDGVLFIGTDGPARIVVVQATKAHGAPYMTYSALVSPACNSFAWGSGENLYASASNGFLVKIVARGKQGSPNYGAN